jgi:small subunit ribosomal protein S9
MSEKHVKIKERYVEANGGRKTARARVRLFSSGKGLTINDKDYKQYFKDKKNQITAFAPFVVTDTASNHRATVRVTGSGIRAQSEAVCNAIAKALAKKEPELKKQLRREGFITRDARMVERKKYGLKKARRAPQWQKR